MICWTGNLKLRKWHKYFNGPISPPRLHRLQVITVAASSKPWQISSYWNSQNWRWRYSIITSISWSDEGGRSLEVTSKQPWLGTLRDGTFMPHNLFHKSMLYWQCHKCFASEDGAYDSPTFGSLRDECRAKYNYGTAPSWRQFATAYLDRTLSRIGDKLPAIVGLIQAYQIQIGKQRY